MNYEETQILVQLIAAMEEAIKKMEEYYNKKDIENFENAKNQVIGFQQEITKVIVSAGDKK